MVKKPSVAQRKNYGKLIEVNNHPMYSRAAYLHKASQLCALNHLQPLDRIMSANLHQVAQKALLKLHPVVKRNYCKNKKCHNILLGSKNSKFKVRSNQSKEKALFVRCRSCTIERKFPLKRLKKQIKADHRPSDKDDNLTAADDKKPGVKNNHEGVKKDHTDSTDHNNVSRE